MKHAVYDLEHGGIGRIYQDQTTFLVMVEPIGAPDLVEPFALDDDEQPGGLMWEFLPRGQMMDEATFGDFVASTWGGPSGWNLRWLEDEDMEKARWTCRALCAVELDESIFTDLLLELAPSSLIREVAERLEKLAAEKAEDEKEEADGVHRPT